MRWLADLAYLLGALAYLPVLAYQMLFQRKNRRGWRERFGHLALPPAQKPRIWLHAVSLGEINATPRLVETLQRRFPHRQVVVSATTDTGYARGCVLYGRDRVFRYPLDFSWVARRVLDRVGADLIVLMELEVWYNLVRMATRRGIRVAVVNGRLTPHSAKWLARLGQITRSMFGDLAWVGAQDEAIAARFCALGTRPDRVEVTGSMKWDTALVTDAVDGAAALADALGVAQQPERRPLWVCGSTGPGEEKIILDTYQALLDAGVGVTLVIVPRKPERFGQVADLIRQRSLNCVRRSECPDDTPANTPPCSGTVILGDTMGELRKFYALATVVFVGRSLVPMGGSDPMEAAALGRPLLVGPHMENFAAPVERLRAAQALRVVASAAELADAVRSFCTHPEEARLTGRRSQEAVIANQGATDKTVDALERLIA